MAFRARVYLQRPPPRTDAIYLGEIDIDTRPILHSRVRFAHNGQMTVGHIEMLTPLDWFEKGLIPTVRVVQR